MFRGESHMSDEDFYNYMKEVDLNGDGLIDYYEFEQMMLQLLSQKGQATAFA